MARAVSCVTAARDSTTQAICYVIGPICCSIEKSVYEDTICFATGAVDGGTLDIHLLIGVIRCMIDEIL